MDERVDGIRIAVLLGTARPGNYTRKALALVLDELDGREGVDFELVDPGALELPPPSLEPPAPVSRRIQETVARATGVIFATPEYHGSFSSTAKLVVENLGFPSVLAGKPVALLGVAAGQIGAVKALEHLRGVLSHVGAIVLPGAVSVARVRELFDAGGACTDPNVESRIRGVATKLLDYVRDHVCPGPALEGGRSDGGGGG